MADLWLGVTENVTYEVAAEWRKTTRHARRAQKALPGFRLGVAADRLPSGCSPLPQGVWSFIFRKLAATLEPEGIRSCSVVAADIIRAGLACRDMYHASREGLAALAETVPLFDTPRRLLLAKRPAPTGTIDWARMDCVLARPMDHPVSELKAVLKQFGLEVPPTKPGMVLRLLNYFGLKQRCTVPARLQEAIRQERRLMVCGYIETYSPPRGDLGSVRLPLRQNVMRRDLVQAIKDLRTGGEVAVVRALDAWRSASEVLRHLCYAFGDTEGLMAAHRGLDASKERSRKRAVKQRVAQVRGNLSSLEAMSSCICGNQPGRQCSLRLCAPCCRTYSTIPCGRSKHNKIPHQPGSAGIQAMTTAPVAPLPDGPAIDASPGGGEATAHACCGSGSGVTVLGGLPNSGSRREDDESIPREAPSGADQVADVGAGARPGGDGFEGSVGPSGRELAPERVQQRCPSQRPPE